MGKFSGECEPPQGVIITGCAWRDLRLKACAVCPFTKKGARFIINQQKPYEHTDIDIQEERICKITAFDPNTIQAKGGLIGRRRSVSLEDLVPPEPSETRRRRVS